MSSFVWPNWQNVPSILTGYSDPLKYWRDAYRNSPETAKIVFLGDSTSDGSGNASAMYSYIEDYLLDDSGPLRGVQFSNVIDGGNNGQTLAGWLSGDSTYSRQDLIDDSPDVIVAGWLTNDVRQGAITLADAIDLLSELVEFCSGNIPNASLILRMPCNFTTTVVGTDYVANITHQAATDILRQSYLEIRKRYPNVIVLDLMGDIFGYISTTTSNLKSDEIHPNSAGYEATARAIFAILGEATGFRITDNTSRYYYEGFCPSAGSGYIDLARPYGFYNNAKARELPLTNGDVLQFSNGDTLTLASATFAIIGDNMRVLMSGDHSAYAGSAFNLALSHGGPGAQEGRYFATISPGSVAAGATLDVTHTISGITREMGVVLQPDSGIISTGLMWAASISANDTVTIRLYNPTGSAIDMSSGTSWRIWILR